MSAPNHIDSPDLDLETIFSAQGTLAEVESMGIKNLLESNGITAVVYGDSVLPVTTFDVRVARDQAARAREIVTEAQAGGPLAAEEAEKLSESETDGAA